MALVSHVVTAGAVTTVDSCGYPDTSSALSGSVFNESTVTRWAQVNGTDPATATIGVFANDETSLLLGVGNNVSPFVAQSVTTLSTPLTLNSTYTSISVNALKTPVSTNDTIVLTGAGKTQNLKATANAAVGATSISVVSFKASAAYPAGSTVSDTTHPVPYGHVSNPNLGDANADVTGRPQYPALFLSDLSSANTNRSGDWQQGGTPFNLIGGVPYAHDVFGTWATAKLVNGTYTAVKPSAANSWNLGPGADTPTTTSLGTDEGYGTEVRWNVTDLGLTPGHKYRVQVMTHDGDQNKTGGDTGEYCTTLTMPGPPVITTSPEVTQTPPQAFNVKAPVGSQISDYALVSGAHGPATGSVTFNLYFLPAGQVPANADEPCKSGTPVPGYASTKTLGADGTATSDAYTTGTALGTYYWQTVYSPTGNAYTPGTEQCGNEKVTLVDARIRLSPPAAVNVVGSPHTVTATVETTEDGAAYTPVTGANVTFSIAPGTAQFVGPSTCTTLANGQCSATINDTAASTNRIHATTMFTVSAGTFTRSTGSTDCTGDATSTTCDATKTYINPKTQLTVTDKFVGLPTSATGSVTYTYFPDATCAPGTGTSSGGGTIGAGGAIPSSDPVTVGPGETKYFVVHYSGNLSPGFDTPCTAETASSAG